MRSSPCLKESTALNQRGRVPGGSAACQRAGEGFAEVVMFRWVLKDE